MKYQNNELRKKNIRIAMKKAWQKRKENGTNKLSKEHRNNIKKNHWIHGPNANKINKKIGRITKKAIKKAIKNGYSPIRNIIENIHIRPNKPEKILIEIIKKHKLPYKYVGDGKFWIENINPDFVESNGRKIAIEIFSDYYHNPLLKTGLKWNQTFPGRKAVFKRYGWKSIILWENEIYKGEDYILNKLK